MTDNPASEATRKQLASLHKPLLRLHKVLLDSERESYEAEHGAVSMGQMLQLVIQHEQFAWLRSISSLIVRIDELLDQKDPPATEEEAQALLTQLSVLLKPDQSGDEFQRKYHAALQREPAAVVVHKEVMGILS